jgi:hypothetical protein
MDWGDYDCHMRPRRGQPIFSKKYFKLLKLCDGRFVLQPVFLGYEWLPERYPYRIAHTGHEDDPVLKAK